MSSDMMAAWERQFEASENEAFEWHCTKQQLADWTLVKLTRLNDNVKRASAVAWIYENVKGGYDFKAVNGEFLFENPKEAMWFTMRWGDHA